MKAGKRRQSEYKEISMSQATVALIGVVIGILGSYGGIFMTNKFQIGRERKARLGELRLSVFKEVNDLAAEFLQSYLKDPSQYRMTDQFYKDLMVTTALPTCNILSPFCPIRRHRISEQDQQA